MFGMGTGISSPPWPPGNNCLKKRKRKKEQTKRLPSFHTSFYGLGMYSVSRIARER